MTHVLHERRRDMLEVSANFEVSQMHFVGADHGRLEKVRGRMYGIWVRGGFLVLDCRLYNQPQHISCDCTSETSSIDFQSPQ